MEGGGVGVGGCVHFVSSFFGKRRKQKMFGNNEREFVFCCQLNSQSTRDRCWFHYSKKVVTIAFLSSFSVDCQCLLRRFSPVFRAIFPVTSIPSKASAKATISAVLFGGNCIVWTLKELNIYLHIALSFFGLSTEFLCEMRIAHCSVNFFFLGSTHVP